MGRLALDFLFLTINQLILKLYYTNDIITYPSNKVMNKTRTYLVQQLHYYGDEFIKHIATNNVLTFAIQDYGRNISEDTKKLEPHLYMLFDVNGEKVFGHYQNIEKARMQFHESLSYYKKHASYIMDYCYDSNKTGHMHVVVIKLPFPEKFKLFLNGKYSEMYSQNEIEKWFIKEIEIIEIDSQTGKKTKTRKLTDQYQILTKDKDYFDIFKNTIKEEFGVVLKEYDGREYDLPLKLNREILRFDSERTLSTNNS